MRVGLLNLLLRKSFLIRIRSTETLFNVNEDFSEINVTIASPYDQRVAPLQYVYKMKFDVSNMTVQNLRSDLKGGSFCFPNPGWHDPLFTIQNMTYSNVSSVLEGGSIYLKDVYDIDVKDISVSDGSASAGGFMYISDVSSLRMNNIDSKNTQANADQGGFVYFANGLFAELDNISISNSQAIGNGGGISLDAVTNVSISKSIFEKTRSDSMGGAAFVRGDYISINNSKFYNSYAMKEGGSINVLKSKDVQVFNSQFFGSFSNSSGGSLYINETSNLSMENIIILDSYSSSRGGSMSIGSSSNISLKDIETRNSTSILQGGCFDIKTQKGNLSNLYFESCKSITQSGGALNIVTTIYSVFDISSCYFGYCVSKQQGGAVNIEMSGSFGLFLNTECTYYNCSSANNGGAIYLSTGSHSQAFLNKICGFQCQTTSTSETTSRGIFLFGSFSSNNSSAPCIISSITTCKCGQTNSGSGTLYLMYGYQELSNLNQSENNALFSPALYLQPYFSLSSTFLNIYKNSAHYSSSTYCAYISNPSSSSNSALLQYSNVIQNFHIYSTSSSIIFFANTYTSMVISMSSCIFLRNQYFLFRTSSSSYIPIIRFGYIYHTNSLGGTVTYEQSLSKNVETATYTILPYSTYYCEAIVPIQQQEYPCQTIPPVPTQIDECRTIPPEPTSCILVTINDGFTLLSLSRVFNIICFSLLELMG